MVDQPSSVRAKEHDPAAWAVIRGVFTELYQSGDHTLKEIATIMKRDHGFDANERQWKGKIRNWSLAKNIKSDEAIFMLYKKAIREYREGKKTAFRLNGRRIEERRLAQAGKKFKSKTNSAGIWSPSTLLSINMDTPRNITYHTPHSGNINNVPDSRETYSFRHIGNIQTLPSWRPSPLHHHLFCCDCFDHISYNKVKEHLLSIHGYGLEQLTSLSCALCSTRWFGPFQNLLSQLEKHVKKSHGKYRIDLNYSGDIAPPKEWRLIRWYGGCYYETREEQLQKSGALKRHAIVSGDVTPRKRLRVIQRSEADSHGLHETREEQLQKSEVFKRHAIILSSHQPTVQTIHGWNAETTCAEIVATIDPSSYIEDLTSTDNHLNVEQDSAPSIKTLPDLTFTLSSEESSAEYHSDDLFPWPWEKFAEKTSGGKPGQSLFKQPSGVSEGEALSRGIEDEQETRVSLSTPPVQVADDEWFHKDFMLAGALEPSFSPSWLTMINEDPETLIPDRSNAIEDLFPGAADVYQDMLLGMLSEDTADLEHWLGEHETHTPAR